MVLSVKGFRKVHHTGKYSCLVIAILLGEDKVNEFYEVMGDGVSLKPPILSEVNFVFDMIHNPLHNKLLSHLTEEGGE